MRKYFFLFLLLLPISILSGQDEAITSQEKLRGSITKERVWWDLLHYKLEVKVDDEKRFISGSNTIKYKVLENYRVMQIDLQAPLKITKVIQNNQELRFKTKGNAHFIELSEDQIINNIYEIELFYEGIPKEGAQPPWSGGFTWSKDNNGNSFIATSNQGIGASIWWPCKDHMYDEPDEGALLIITPPKGLMNVSNGRLKKTIENSDGTKTYYWEVLNPINNYGININIGDYVHFSEKYQGLKGELDCDYYVISYNLEKAKEQFKQAAMMLEAFEHWFGPYPFYEDGYKLVEVPYLGMEHQSSVTYGNNYKNGYNGRDLSGTGTGLRFDYIIIHESGHEWFANNITYIDIADMWIHESFTSYSEVLYLDYHFGTKAGNRYIIGTRRNNISNDKPIIGIYGANREGSTDMYYKGANMIHTLRQVINDDLKFREILVGLNKEFYHKTVTTQEIEAYISKESGMDLSAFFDQYLRTIKIPILEYKVTGSTIEYKYRNTVKGFNIPLKVLVNDKEQWIHPTSKWKDMDAGSMDVNFEIDPNFYIIISEVR